MPPFPDEHRTPASQAGAEDSEQKDTEKEERALEDAICSVMRGGGRRGVGVLVSLHGNTGPEPHILGFILQHKTITL